MVGQSVAVTNSDGDTVQLRVRNPMEAEAVRKRLLEKKEKTESAVRERTVTENRAVQRRLKALLNDDAAWRGISRFF